VSDFDDMIRAITRRFAYLEAKVEAQDRYINNIFREGRVTKLHAEDGLAEVDADGLPTAKVPWITRAGTRNVWDPPAVDERVMIINPSGDPGRGLILPGGYSDKFKQPHNKAGEYKDTLGKLDTIETEDRHRKMVKDGSNESRFVVRPGYAKIAFKGGGTPQYVVVTKDGIVMSSTPTIGPDPEPSL
jgi:hypothetical protein